jgi:hypothetical protein
MTELMSKAPSANYIARQRKLPTKFEFFSEFVKENCIGIKRKHNRHFEGCMIIVFFLFAMKFRI